MSKPKECVFCGAVGKWTRDHVPPRSLFDPAPPNLITVPACTGCNSGTSKDDEYFRMFFVAREDLESNRSIQNPKAAFLRSLQHPEAQGLRKTLSDALQPVTQTTPAGAPETKPALEIDVERIRGTVQKIVKGLFAHKLGRRLPDTHIVHVLSWNEASDPDTGELREAFKEFVDGLSREPRHSVGEPFRFFFRQIGEGTSEASFWLLVFYERVIFFAWTTPQEEPAV